MSSSEKDYLLRTPPPPSQKVFLIGVTIGALVGGLLLALALSTIALATNLQENAIGRHSDESQLFERVVKLSSTPISAKVLYSTKIWYHLCCIL